MRVLGIDPGLATTGYGVVENNNQNFQGLDYGIISTPSDQTLEQRIFSIYNNVIILVNRFSPEMVAVEKLFFCKNISTAVQVGEARGAIFTAAAEKQLPIFEYTPLQVKQAVAGYGRAEKRQVQHMVAIILKLPQIPSPDDAADALAVALCHLQSYKWQQLTGEKVDH